MNETLQDKFKRIKELAESGMYERNPDAQWTDADLILSLAKGLLRRLDEEKARRKWK